MANSANRFLAPTLNPAHLPIPDAIEVIDQEAILDERMGEFQARADQAGFPYDVGGLEFDPIKIDQEAHAHREALMRARVNSAVRAVLPAYAQGTDLDAIVARANVHRLTLVPADPDAGTQAVMEDDQSLLTRYLASYAVPSAGSYDGYIYHALTVYPQARDITVLGPGIHGVPGRAAVYLLGDTGDPVPADSVDMVREYLSQNHIKPLTDQLVVQAAGIIPYVTELSILVPRGPAPSTVAAAAKAAVEAAAYARFAIGAQVYANVLEGAAYVANVLRVTRTSPAADIRPGPSQAAFCTAVNINVEVEP
ncbi:baseplate assembly protein [Hyphomicrobium sulfonivorans]|uniref:baseplate assembly protein n=1 Tax=Hyphomicrobium sulfonivorans TaxID=121290 RepID=UPI00156FBD60|nr:baseplate J/gp47 family protein [Hyphomicrobium sulfonivorans]MBI1649877.1 baseplate J/gp47 family protein [Hyphomicrobium sulfonivorans]NSL71788.1 hypothetical protein [Hyphomicrobium sulfonivorans]